MVEAKYKILKILKPNKSRFKQMSYIEKLLQGATVQVSIITTSSKVKRESRFGAKQVWQNGSIT